MSKSTLTTRLRCESLEARDVPALYTPTTPDELVASISAANASLEADTIALSAGATYTLTTVNNSRFGADNGLPVIAKAATAGALTVVGNGATIERNTTAPAFRLLAVAAGAMFTAENLTLRNGLAVGSSGAYGRDGGDGLGGGVYIDGGSVVLRGVDLVGNAARGGRGSDSGYDRLIGNYKRGSGGDGFGGGLYAAGGSVTLSGCDVTGNTADGGAPGTGKGAAAYGAGIGGGVYIAAGVDFTQTDTTITGNTASSKKPNLFKA